MNALSVSLGRRDFRFRLTVDMGPKQSKGWEQTKLVPTDRPSFGWPLPHQVDSVSRASQAVDCLPERPH